MLKRFVLSWIANIIGLFLSAFLISGINYGGEILALLVTSFIFGLVNSLIRPFVVLLSLPAIVLTLGLFTLVVNTLMLYITSALYPQFQVHSIASAVGAVIIIWLANWSVSLIADREKKA